MKNALTENDKHVFCETTIRHKADLETGYILFGGRLCRIKDERLWEAGWDSWDEYLMEMKLTDSSASRIMNIYRTFRLRFGIPEKKLALAGGWTVLAEYLPLVRPDTTKEEVDEWVEDAARMPRKHIREHIMEKRKGVSISECKHDFYLLRCCKKCPYRERVMEITVTGGPGSKPKK